MTTNPFITVNRSVKIDQSTGLLMLTKSYAEKNLTKQALSYGEQTPTHYTWEWGKTAYIVIFELPKLFNIPFQELLRYMVNYCLDYMKERNLKESVFYNMYMENYNKPIKG